MLQACKTVYAGPLLGLFVVLALEIFGGSLSIPVFAFFCIQELHLDAGAVGVLVSSFNLAQSLGGPFFGRASDAVGRRAILLLCFAWSSTCFAATAGVGGFWGLLAVRTLAGLSGGSIPVAAAVIMDCADAGDRPRVLGIKGAVLGLTFMCSTLLVVVLLTYGVPRRQIFVLAAFMCGLGCAVGCCILRESLPEGRRRPWRAQGAEVAWLGDGVREDCGTASRGLMLAWCARFFYAFCVFCLYATYSFLIRDNFGWADREFGLILCAAGLAKAVLELLLYPTASARLGEHWVCAIGAAVLALGLAALPAKNVWVHLSALFVFNVGQSLCEPGLINLTGFHAPSEKHMGFAQGTSNGFKAMASVLGPLAAGRMYVLLPASAYFMASGFAALACATVLLAVGLGEDLAEPGEGQRLLEAGVA